MFRFVGETARGRSFAPITIWGTDRQASGGHRDLGDGSHYSSAQHDDSYERVLRYACGGQDGIPFVRGGPPICVSGCICIVS